MSTNPAARVTSGRHLGEEHLGSERCGDAATLVVVVQVSPARLDWLAALAESDTVFSSRFGIAVEPGWSGFPEALPAAVATARQRPDDPWGTYLFFDDDEALVGIGGCKGPPADGEVEIGYAVSPSRQGRGIPTAAVRWFLAHATRAGVAVVIAHTLAAVNPSTRVLTKTGFVRTTTLHDPEVGELWRWERASGCAKRPARGPVSPNDVLGRGSERATFERRDGP